VRVVLGEYGHATVFYNSPKQTFVATPGIPDAERSKYAAELAIRWYREHRAITKKLPRVAPFKCGPKENGEAWRLIVDEFFGGVDLVPACK
jgi:hypothetical protein